MTDLIQRQVKGIVARVYALDDPWRTRFLETIAGLVGKGHVDPGQDQLTQWLLEDAQLRGNVNSMLHSWLGGHFW